MDFLRCWQSSMFKLTYDTAKRLYLSSVYYKRRRGDVKNTKIIFPTGTYRLMRHKNTSVPIASTFLFTQKIRYFAATQVSIQSSDTCKPVEEKHRTFSTNLFS